MSSQSVLRNVISPRSATTAAASLPPGRQDPLLLPAERRLLEDEMEGQLGILIDNVPVALAMFDTEMRYILANKMWVSEFNLQAVLPVEGLSQYDIFPSLHPGWRQVYDRALQGHVVRSEHDAISSTDSQPTVYRGEVRPWRRKRDASVGGLMIICEKLPHAAAASGDAMAKAPAAPPAQTAEAGPSLLFQSSLPVVVLDHAGVIADANDAAISAALDRGIRLGATFFWDAFGGGRDHALHRQQVADAIASLHESTASPIQAVTVRRDAATAEGSLPCRWLLARSASTEETKLIVAVAVPESTVIESAPKVSVQLPPASASTQPVGLDAAGTALVQQLQSQLERARSQIAILREAEDESARLREQAATADALARNLRSELDRVNQELAALREAAADAAVRPETSNTELLHKLQAQLEHARQEVSVLREAESAFARREGRQRAVMEALPCGLIVLDEKGMPIYSNQQIAKMIGRGIQRGDTVEQWLSPACPSEDHRAEVCKTWSELVWRRQIAKAVSLLAADGSLKEFGLRPSAMTGGGTIVSVHDVSERCRTQEQVESAEARCRVLLHETATPVLIADRSGAVYEANVAAERLLSRSKADLRRLNIDTWLAPRSVQDRRTAMQAMREQGRRSMTLDVEIISPAGLPRAAKLHLAVVADASGRLHSTVHFIQPAVERAEPAAAPGQASGSSHGLAASHAASSPAVVWLLQTDANGRIVHWTEDAAREFGITADQAAGRWLHSFFRPSDATGFFADLQSRLAAPNEPFEWAFITQDGRRETGWFYVKPAADGGHAVDLFEHREQAASPAQPAAAQPPGQARAELFQSEPARTHLVKPSQLWPVADLDREKLLLSETHHRIKNHLQIISSMLNLQLNTLTDQQARIALRSSQNRVRSIAALHQLLYQFTLGEGTGFADFAQGLAQRLRECYEAPEDRIAQRWDISPAPVQQEWLMPLALILNETLSNAFEHAFPAGRSGTVNVRLRIEGDQGEFEVADDGIGPPEGFDPVISPGLGLKILGVFADQMHGELRLSGEPGKGTKFNLRFPMAHIDN